MSTVAVIDYGMGNLYSVGKALNKVAPNAKVLFSANAKAIASADRILLPGQGAIGACMARLQRLDLLEALKSAAKVKPFLGICIGPQLMMQHSAENGGVAGLGLFAGQVIKFDDNLFTQQHKIKIPHMGWNTIHQTHAHPLWRNIANNSYFYYVHSYHLHDCQAVIGQTHYGIDFPAVIAHDNIAGLQAHPEVSAQAGLQFLANFMDWQP